MQASLLSNIRSNPEQSVLFHYSNLQHLREYRPTQSELSIANPSQTSICLEQNLARTLTHVAQQAFKGTEGHASDTSPIFEARSIYGEIRTACRRFIDLIYDRSDNAHFVGSFIDAYDIFISGVFYILLEQPQCPRGLSDWSKDDLNGARQSRLSVTIDVVNKCCTLITGIESRFGAVKVFRRVLREFFAVMTGQLHPERSNAVRKANCRRVWVRVFCLHFLC